MFHRRAVLPFFVVLTINLSLQAGVIGTFSTDRDDLYGLFNLYEGAFSGHMQDAVTNDGHELFNLDAGINASSLEQVDLVYLPLTQYNEQILSATEVTALQNFVTNGGNLVIQSDYEGYSNLLGAYGIVQNTLNVGSGVTTTVSTDYAPLTDGPHGTVSSLSTAVASSFTMPAGGYSLDTYGTVGVMHGDAGLSTGSGHLVVLGDINTFDGPGNTDGYTSNDGGTLWRNILALSDLDPSSPGDNGNELPPISQVPEPGTMSLLILSFICLGGAVGTKRKK